MRVLWFGLVVAGCAYQPADGGLELSGSPPGSDPTVDSGTGTGVGSAFALPMDGLWAVVHPTEAPPPGPGIVHIDGSGAETARLPLPADARSPHGLAFDGATLWLSDLSSGKLYGIDPADGAVLSELPDVWTEGVALDGDGFWVGSEKMVRIDAAGAVTDVRPGSVTVQDIAFDGADVLFLTNGSRDTVTRVGPTGDQRELANAVTRNNTGYAMALYDGALVVVDQAMRDEPWAYGTNVLRFEDPNTGAVAGAAELPIEGWVTAIAP